MVKQHSHDGHTPSPGWADTITRRVSIPRRVTLCPQDGKPITQRATQLQILKADPYSSPSSVLNLEKKLKLFKTKHQKLVRMQRLKCNLKRDFDMFAACSDLNKLSHIIQAKRNRTQDIHKLHVGNKVYEGQKVPDGMFESISSLKKLDTEALSSSESFVSASQTYKHILEICRAGSKVPKLSAKKAEKFLKSMRPSVNDYFSITASHYLNSGESGFEHFCNHIND